MKTTSFNIEIASVAEKVLMADGAATFMKHLERPDSPRAPLTADQRPMVAGMAWLQVDRLVSELSPWITELEKHGEGSHEGNLRISLKGILPQWFQQSLETFIVRLTVAELLGSEEPAVAAYNRSDAASTLEAIKNILRRRDFGHNPRIIPHYY